LEAERLGGKLRKPSVRAKNEDALMGEAVDAITVGAAVLATALAAYSAFLSRSATEAVRHDVDLAKSVAKVDFAYRVEAELMAMYDELRASVGPVDTDIEPVEPDLRRTVYRLVTIHSMAYSAFHASVLPEDSWNAIDAECSYWLHRDPASPDDSAKRVAPCSARALP